MSKDYVVGITCTSVKEVEEQSKALVYCFEVTWSDESKSNKELSSDDLHQFKKELTKIYSNRREISIPDVPDGKVGGFVSKAKKAEKRRKQIEEFCTLLINLPHQPGKLQAIRNLFGDEIPDQPPTTNDHHTQSIGVEKKNAVKPVLDGKTSNELKDNRSSAADYALVIPKSQRSKGSLNYVQVEFLHRQKSREAKKTVAPVYAEVVLMKAPQHPEWLSQPDDDSDDEQTDRKNHIKSQTPFFHPGKVPTPPPINFNDDDVAETAGVLVPEVAHEMPDCDESKPKSSSDIGAPAPNQQRTMGEGPSTIFDAAMLSNFPEGTLVPLPPDFTPDPCPPSLDLKLSKKGQPPKDDINHTYVVSICDWKVIAENTLTFKRGQKAMLLYTSAAWWFIRTKESVGWVPGDHWRIVTDWKMISGKPLAPFAPWNFGVLDRNECQALLRNGSQEDFLIRESSNSTGHLVLSVLHSGRVHHFEVQLTDQGSFYIGDHFFKTLHNVILYYKKKTLFNDTNGKGFRLGRLFVKR